MRFKINKKELYKIKIAGTNAVFTNVNRTYETEDEKEIEILKKARWVTLDIDSTEETLNLSAMNLKELTAKAKEFGVSTDVTAENKNVVIKEILRKMGA